MRYYLTLAIATFAASCTLQSAQAAGCEGWWWDKISCLEKRVEALEAQQTALRNQLAELPKTFSSQIAAVDAKLAKHIAAENKDVAGQINKALKQGIKIRNGQLDTCLFSDSLGVGGFRRCSNDDKEVWLLQ